MSQSAHALHDLMDQRDEQTALMARPAGGGGAGIGGGDYDSGGDMFERDSLPGSDDDSNAFTRRPARSFDGVTRQARPARNNFGGASGVSGAGRLRERPGDREERAPAGDRDRERERGADMPPVQRPVTTLERIKLDALFPPTLDRNGAEIEHECFACHYARNDCVPRVAVQGYHGLMMLVQSADSGTCRVTLSDEVRRFYESEIREPGNRFVADGMRPFPEWPTRTIFKHYFSPEHGRNDARASVRWRTHVLENVVYTMANNGLFVETQEGAAPPTRSVNYPVLELFLKANNALNQMVKMDLNKLGGAGSSVAPPTQTASNTLMGPDRVHVATGGAKIRSALMH
jgi:hypothetical protein